MTERYRNLCFTNYNMEYDYTELKEISSYLIYGIETCPTTNKKHHQGYCELKNQTRFKTLQKLLQNMHIEKRKGTAKQASDYCKKDGEYTEYGNISHAGKRNDIIETYEAAKNNCTFNKYLEEHTPSFQNLRIFQIARAAFQPKRNFKPKVYWIYGATGTGKSSYVVNKEKDLWISGKSLRWWDGYENQEATLFDDFRKDFCTYHELLRILDRHPYRVEYKGGSVELNSKRMYITSCYHPEDIYDTREDIGQLLRRIRKIIKM